MKRESAIAVAAGVLGAMLLVAAWRGSVFGVFAGLLLSPLPLAMAVLGLGLAYMPVAVAAGAATVTVLTGSFIYGAIYLVVDAAPVAILTRIGLAAESLAKAAEPDQAPPLADRTIGLTVVTLVMVALAVMMIGLAFFPASPDGFEAALYTRLQQLVTEAGAMQAAPEAARTAMIKAMARVLPGAAAWNWCFRALISVVLAQMLLARDGFARWPTPAYRTFAVPGGYIGVFWVAVVAAWLIPGDTGFLAANAAAVLSLPLVLQGLAVVHCTAAHFGYGRFALVMFYGVALVAAGPALVLVASLGIVDHFLKMRARMAVPQNGGK